MRRKVALEVDRLRRRSLHLLLDAADDLLHGPQEAGSSPLRLQDVANQEGGGRLPVRARDADDPQAWRSGHPRSGRPRWPSPPGRRDPRLGHGQVQQPLDHEARGAALDGSGSELVTVRAVARNAEEQAPGFNGPAVIGESGDLRLGVSNQLGDLDVGEQLAEVHRRRL